VERIRVDFNRRGPNGALVSSTKRATGPVAVGERVQVYQPGESDMDTTAIILSIDEAGRVLLSPEVSVTFSFMPANRPLWLTPQQSTATGMSEPGHRVLEGVGALQ
jgi:hypothetical protein